MIRLAPPTTGHDLIVVTESSLPGDVLIATRITLTARIGKLDGFYRLAVELSQTSSDHRQFARRGCASLLEESKEIFALGRRDVNEEEVR